MKETMLSLYRRHRESIWYLIIGGITTVIDLVSFALLTGPLGIGELFAKTIAWVLAVTCAFIGNKWLVFRSQNSALGGEVLRFAIMRVLTLAFSWGFLYLTINLAGWNGNLSNLLCNVVVIVLNYILSKTLVFKQAK
jgi:putative flippase GtrA